MAVAPMIPSYSGFLKRKISSEMSGIFDGIYVRCFKANLM